MRGVANMSCRENLRSVAIRRAHVSGMEIMSWRWIISAIVPSSARICTLTNDSLKVKATQRHIAHVQKGLSWHRNNLADNRVYSVRLIVSFDSWQWPHWKVPVRGEIKMETKVLSSKPGLWQPSVVEGRKDNLLQTMRRCRGLRMQIIASKLQRRAQTSSHRALYLTHRGLLAARLPEDAVETTQQK